MKALFFSFLLLTFCISMADSQIITLGGRLGLSDLSSSTGLQIGATGDYAFKHNMLIGTDLNLNTQDNTPFEWANYFKYLIDLPTTNAQPYVDAGFSIWAFTGGPYFGLRFGGGVYFPLTNQLYIPADLQLGPVFTNGSSSFYFVISSGIRYVLPN